MDMNQAQIDSLSILQNAANNLIGVQKSIFDICGNWNEANVLSELWYWTSPSTKGITKLRIIKDGFRWLACTRIEWWERRRLTTREVDRAIVNLMKKNLVIKHIYKFNGAPTIHLRLNIDEFLNRYIEACKNLVDFEILADDQELLEAKKMMNWDNLDNPILHNVSNPFYTKGENINSNIHSNLQNHEDEKKFHILTDENISDLKDQSNLYGKPKPQKRISKYKLSHQDLENVDKQIVNTIAFSDQAKSKQNTLLPEQYHQQASWFMQYTGLSYVPKFRSLWIDGFEEWNNLGANEEDVMKAAQKLQSAGLSIMSPSSLTKTLNSVIAQRKTKKEYNPWG